MLVVIYCAVVGVIVAGAAWLAVFVVCSVLLVIVTIVVAVCGLLCWTMSDVSVATDVACGSVSQVDRHVIVDDVAFGAAPGVATDNRKGCNHMLMFAVILATCCDHNLSARRLSLMGLCFACVCVACHPAGCAGNRSGLRQSFSKPAGCASVSRQQPVAGCVASVARQPATAFHAFGVVPARSLRSAQTLDVAGLAY